MENNYGYYSFEEIYSTLEAIDIKKKKAEFENKMEMLKRFQEAFPNYSFSLNFFQSTFPFREFFTKEMSLALEKTGYYRGNPENFIEYVGFLKSSLFGYFSFNQDISRDKLLGESLPSRFMKYCQHFFEVKDPAMMKTSWSFEGFLDDVYRNSSKLFYYTELLDHNLFPHLSKGKQKEIVQTIILQSPRVDEFLPQFSEFSQLFPMILLNNLASDEEKTKIIGKYYQKKNIHLYEEIIRKKLENFDILIPFIDGTVIKNNRILDKASGIQNVLHRFLFKSKKSSIPSGAFSFIERYREYISVGMIVSEFNLMNTNSDIITQFAAEFIKTLPIKEQLRIITKHCNIFSEDFRRMTYKEIYDRIYEEAIIDSNIDDTVDDLNWYVLKQDGEYANQNTLSRIFFNRGFGDDGMDNHFYKILNNPRYEEKVNKLLFTYDCEPRYLVGDSLVLFKGLVKNLTPEKRQLLNFIKKDEKESLLLSGAVVGASYYNPIFSTVARIQQIFKLAEREPEIQNYIHDAFFEEYIKDPDAVFLKLTEIVQNNNFLKGTSGYSGYGALPGLTGLETDVFRRTFTKTELLELFFKPMAEFLDKCGDIETKEKIKSMCQELTLIVNL